MSELGKFCDTVINHYDQVYNLLPFVKWGPELVTVQCTCYRYSLTLGYGTVFHLLFLKINFRYHISNLNTTVS
jgi:hypothetical protein